MRYQTFVIALALAVVGGATRAQEPFTELSGKVTDAATGAALPFASIRVHQKNTGTLSNEDGRFLFKLASTQLQDSIEISYIGYASIVMPAQSLRAYSNIPLKEATSILAEMTVSSKNGLDIIKEMLARIPVNFDTTGKKLQAYYLEEIALGKDSITHNEAVLDVYKASYTKHADKDQLNLLKGRRRKINWRGDPLYGWLSGLSNGAGNSLAEDVIKNRISENNPLDPANFKYYNFRLVDVIGEGDKGVYVIALSPTKKAPKSKLTIEGKIFVRAGSMAPEKIEWHLSPNGNRYLNRHRGYGYRIAQAAYQMSLVFTGVHEVITFSELDHKWYLKEVLKEITADVSSAKRNMVNAPWNAKTLFAVTHIGTGIATPWDEKDNIMNQKASVGRLITGHDTDMAFWENYNVVQPAYTDTISHRQHSNVVSKSGVHASGRQHGFTRADSLQGKLTPLRTCYDVLFYHLDISIDPSAKSVKGFADIRFRIVEPFRKIQVDLYANMKIDSIVFHGRHLTFARELNAVYIDFPSLQPGDGVDHLRIFYQGIPKSPDFSIPMNGGFLWSQDSNGKPWVESVCQGSGASIWWPNKDHLSDEPDSARITVTVPAGLTDISNGILKSKRTLPDGRMQFDWYVSYPVNNYNIVVNVGDYVHFGDTFKGLHGNFPMNFYCLAASEEKAKKLFSSVKHMLTLYEKDFGPYPFPRDGFTLMESLYPMEHQSAVSIGKLGTFAEDTIEMEALKRLMWHESSHEWWGNNVSIKDMADFWVHEAFATYAEAICIEDESGYEASSAFMNEQEIANKEPIIGVRDVNHIFYDLGDIYNKGCLMLNTLRHVIANDTIWFNLLRGIQKTFAMKTVTSADIESFISRETKTDYGYFFDQYLRFAAPPKLVVLLKQEGNNTSMAYRWQADVKNFRMPVRVTGSDGKFETIYPTTTSKTLLLKNLKTEDFEVDQNDFYVKVELH